MNPPARAHGDEGSVMPMAAILVAFLMLASWALVSASQQWAARRDAYAAAAAAARAGAQADPGQLRAGAVVLDVDGATARARQVLSVTGHTGTVTVAGEAVTVTVTAGVDYAFPSPGFADQVVGTATAVVLAGVRGDEAGG